MDQYKLSIVVLVYNLEKYLPKCLDSLLDQTLDGIEIICVNDGSPDNSQDIIDRYVKKYPTRIKSFVKPNEGEWSTRNYGLERATGEFVTFVDNDDYPQREWAEKLYNAANTNNADMAVCAFERVDINTGKVNAIDMKWRNQQQVFINSNEHRLAFINPAPWNKIYRRSKIQHLRFLPLRGFSDMCFLMSSYLYMESIVIIPDILYCYNVRDDSQIHSINEEDVENAKKALLSVKKLYDSEPRGEQLSNLLAFMAFIHLGISIMYRVSYAQGAEVKKVLKNVILFLDNSFPLWRKTKFLKMTFAFGKGIKYTALAFISQLYKRHMAMVFLRIYRFVHDKLKLDIKW